MKKLSTTLATLALLTSCALFVAPANAGPGDNHHAEQIIFSGQGTGIFNDTPTGFGFWIWCQDDDAQTPYAGNCNGAMYFYALDITVHVSGDVDEISQGIYEMDVASTNANQAVVSCTLTNDSADLIHGPHNDVSVVCPAPNEPSDVAGNGHSDSAVVNVTGRD